MLDPLLDKLTKEFPTYSRIILKNVLVLAVSILKKETICLYRLSSSVGVLLKKESLQSASHYKRLLRIFDKLSVGVFWLHLLRFVFQLFRLKSDYLLLDGTSWSHGKRYHHLMTLCVVYKGVAIPIFWQDLEKKGISTEQERIRLLKRACCRFHLKDKVLLADREYIGLDWFDFLRDQGLDFVIRLRSNAYKNIIDRAEGKTHKAMSDKVLRSKKVNKALGKTIQLKGKNYQFVVVKNPDLQAEEKVIYLLSSLQKKAVTIAAMYPIRWKIESCFKHLKSNGFDLEKMNLKRKNSQRLLMAILIFAYAISVYEGLKSYKKVKTKIYKDNKQYKEISVFRHGLNSIQRVSHSLMKFLRYIIRNIIDKIPVYRSPRSIFVQ